MKAKIQHIEKLRGISILLVLLFHLEIPGFQYGYLGVDIFFVISGFLMAMLYGNIATTSEILDYFYRRCVRILPAYYVVILLASVAGIFMLLPHEIDMLMKQSLWSVVLAPNIGFFRDAAYFDYTLFRPLLNLWSLGVELQFYLLFPLLLIVERISRRLLLLIVCLSFLEYGLFSAIDPRNAFFLLPGRIWEFMLGFYASRYLPAAIAKLRGGGGILLLGLIVFIVTLSAIGYENNFLFTCVVIGLAYLVVQLGFETGSESGVLSRSLLSLGKYSYSIYLVHFPVIVFLNYVPFEGTILAAESPVDLALILLTTGILSVLLHHLVENRTRGRLAPRRLLALSMTFCAAIAILSQAAPTLNRLSHSFEEINVSAALLDRDTRRCERPALAPPTVMTSCEVGDYPQASQRRFLLHGDSHADGIKLPLAEILAEQSHSLRISGDYAAINSVNDSTAVMAEAVARDIDVIVLHALPQADNGEALEGFIRLANENAIYVAFIAPVPNYEFDIPQKLALDLREGLSEIPFGSSLQSHLERNNVLFDRLDRLAASHGNFSWYQSADYLCGTRCRISSEEWIPYYFDSNHLTLTGARLLNPIFAEIAAIQ